MINLENANISQYRREHVMYSEMIHYQAHQYIINKMKELNYPNNHPFNNYPNTANGRALETIIILQCFLNDNEVIDQMLIKCKSTKNGFFDPEIFNQNYSEIVVLYYLIIGVTYRDNNKSFNRILYEPKNIYENNKMIEYSLLFNIQKENSDLINFEVKTITCDPFMKESDLRVINGKQLVKPYFFDDFILEDIKNNYPDATILECSSNYRQISKNLKKIVEKFDGENLTPYRLINVGVIVINFSTSFEEFYSYMLHDNKGLYYSADFGNLDALVLFTCDAKNDLKFDNIYNMGYVQTVLLNDSDYIKNYMEMLRLDNYMLIGKITSEDILKEAQKEYGVFKIIAKEGFLNIIPWSASDDEVDEYINYLKSDRVRYRDINES